MAASHISSAASRHAPNQPAIQSLAQHKHGGHRPHSMAESDGAGSNTASPLSSAGKIGSQLNIRV